MNYVHIYLQILRVPSKPHFPCCLSCMFAYHMLCQNHQFLNVCGSYPIANFKKKKSQSHALQCKPFLISSIDVICPPPPLPPLGSVGYIILYSIPTHILLIALLSQCLCFHIRLHGTFVIKISKDHVE